MPPFPRPSFDSAYHIGSQINALHTYRDTKPGRAIPAKNPNRLLVASWNIANLGVQERQDRDYRLLAEMVSWFDLVAIQEVNDNLSGLRGIMAQLASMPGGGSWRALLSDEAGNNERLAYIYDASKVSLREKVGEIAIPPSEWWITAREVREPDCATCQRWLLGTPSRSRKMKLPCPGTQE
jgi:hypothetical protein